MEADKNGSLDYPVNTTRIYYTVSYTHLDVYKRQSTYKAYVKVSEPGNRTGHAYTHIATNLNVDVYKRQVLQNAYDKEKMQEVLQNEEKFSKVDRETVEAINLFAGTDIDIDEKEEVIDMCKACLLYTSRCV